MVKYLNTALALNTYIGMPIEASYKPPDVGYAETSSATEHFMKSVFNAVRGK